MTGAPVGATRREARRRAVELLFEAEQRRMSPVELLATRIASTEPPVPPFTARLVEGVHEHQATLDEAISTYSRGWTLERMPAVDRAVLRVGAFEAVYGDDDTPPQVAVAEAVRLVTELSTDDSPKFVNGLLSRIATLRETIA